MAIPLIAALPAIAAFIARSGVTAAIKKYGRKAVMKVGENRNKVTKSEKKVGPSGSVPNTAASRVQGQKMPGGTRMPPNKMDAKAAQAARRKANEAAQFGRGATKIKKGAANVGKGVGAAGTAFVGGQAVAQGAKANDKRKNDAEVARLKRLGQKNAFKQAGEREAKKADLANMPAQAKAASNARQAARDAAKKKAEQARARKMSTSTTVTANRSDVEEARKSISGPKARPANRLVGPPTPPKSDLKSSGTPTTPKGDRRTPTAAIVGEKSTGAKGAKNNPVTVAGGKKRKPDTFIGKDGKKKAAVTAEELEASGLSLRDYLNKKQGKTRVKKNMGGKVMGYKSGGMAKGPMKKNMGGKVMAYKAGGGVKSRGTGKARKTNSCTMVKMKGS